MFEQQEMIHVAAVDDLALNRALQLKRRQIVDAAEPSNLKHPFMHLQYDRIFGYF